jgi:hypothetical protein
MSLGSPLLRYSSKAFIGRRTSLAVLLCLAWTVTFTTTSPAQEPFPAPPRTFIDTTWNAPTGTVLNVNNPSGFQLALNLASPGDTIVLAAGVQFSGNFTLPLKPNPNGQWIYIESSALSLLPPPGSRIDPANDEPNMPQIISPNTAPAIAPAPGANHYRLVGLEVTTNSNRGCQPNHNPSINCYTYFLFGQSDGGMGHPNQLPDSITFDRVYMHGSPTQDVLEGIQGNVTNIAVVDSYISDIHLSLSDSQAFIAYFTPGPIKLVDNYLSATTEDVMFGGSGGTNNPYVPSDIEIRRNNFYKPLSWDAPGITLPPHARWILKDNLEFKSAQRVIVTGNTFENTWVSGQGGSSVLFTVRTSQSGNIGVVDDILFQSNIMKNVDSGFQTLEQDYQCGSQLYPNCTNKGESKRVWVDNNLLLLSTNHDTYQHTWVKIDGGNATDIGLTDYIFQHNTALMQDQSLMWSYIFELNGSGCPPNVPSATHNVWVLDNAITRQPTGDCGYLGTTGLGYYMSDPSPLAPRYYGNVMYVAPGERVQSWPGTSNDATPTPFTYVNPSSGDYQLLTPDWINTSDGKISGIDWNEMQNAMNGGMLQITSGTLPSAVVGNAYSTTLTALGGTPPYTWSITSGSLPAGLTLDPNAGTISGTPTTGGNFNFTVTVTDSENPPATASANMSITVSPMSIQNQSLPAGRTGQFYSVTLTASGGFPPLQWAVTNGFLPGGLNLDPNAGTISGTPNTAGIYAFTITVTDSAYPPNAATADLSITIGTGSNQHP